MDILPVQFQLGDFPPDAIALSLFFVAVVLFGIAGGKRFIIPFLFSLYIAYVVVAMLPSLGTFFLRFSVSFSPKLQAIVFLFVVGLSTWLLAGSAVTALFKFSLRSMRQWWQVLAASVLGAGLFASLFFSLLPQGTFRPSSLVEAWFLADPLPFLWALAPVVFFSLLNAREE